MHLSSNDLRSILQTGVASPLVTCSKNDTLHTAFELLAASNGRADRLVCVDEARRVTGIVSLSDILNYFTTNPSWEAVSGT